MTTEVINVLNGVLQDIEAGSTMHLSYAVRNVDTAIQFLKREPNQRDKSIAKALGKLRRTYRACTFGSSEAERWANTREYPERIPKMMLKVGVQDALQILQ